MQLEQPPDLARLARRNLTGRHGRERRAVLDLAALSARTWKDGELVAQGLGEALLGHPLDALAWLANRRSNLGLGLTSGSVVTLGTITPVQWVATPATFRIEVEALGGLGVTVS
jgi:2-keto-4-pentenoate hydratase